MNNQDYSNYIKNILLESLDIIYIIDTIGDKVLRYEIIDDNFEMKEEKSFMDFYNQLEKLIHPDDFNSCIKGLTEDNPDIVKQEYRKKNLNNEYEVYRSTIKQIIIDNKKISVVLVEKAKNDINTKSNNLDGEDISNKYKLAISYISDAVLKTNQLINANCDSNNIEVKSLIKYLENIMDDLVKNIPEVYSNVEEDMVSVTNQNGVKTILVVDDDDVICNLLTKIFSDTYNVEIAHNGRDAIEKLSISNSGINANNQIMGMFLDLNMPEVDGFGVLDYMMEKNLLTKIPVIIVSGEYGKDDKLKAYSYPIADVLEKPFNVQIVKHRINNLVNLYKNNNSLNEIILTGHQQLKEILNMCVKSYLCDESLEISIVTKYTSLLITELNKEVNDYNFDEVHLEKILDAVKYYDIGFASLPRNVRNGKKNDEAEEKMRVNHPLIGLNIFDAILYRSTDSLFNHYAKDIIGFHHEHYDGSGYPYGLNGDNIPIVSQVVGVVSSYVNLSRYIDEDEALKSIISNSGKKYNPVVIKALENISGELKNVWK